MIMTNSTWPNTDRKLLDFFPKALFSNQLIQKMYLKSMLDPVIFKFFYYWLIENDYYKNAYEQIVLN